MSRHLSPERGRLARRRAGGPRSATRRALTFALGVCFLLAGCSWWEPERLEILVDTAPPGAACQLTRGGQPIATVDPTPAIALVEPGAGDIAIHCRRLGFAEADTVLPGGGSGQTRAGIALPPLGPQALLPARR